MRIKKALTFWWHLLPKLNYRGKKWVQLTLRIRTNSSQMEITVLKIMHQKRIQFRTFLICEVLSPGGDRRLDWRAGNTTGEMLELLSSCIPQQDRTGPLPSWASILSPLWSRRDSVPFWNWTIWTWCAVCFIHADTDMEKEEELGLDFQRCSVLNYVDNCICNVQEQLLWQLIVSVRSSQLSM